MVSLGTLIFFLSYMPVNYFNLDRDYYYEFFFQWELGIPQWDWMLIPYVSAYFMPIIPIFKLDRKEQKALLYSILVCCSIGLIIFFLFPTKLGFIRGEGVSDTWLPFYQILWKVDPPHNLFPSQHVVMAYLLCIPALSKFMRREAKAVILTWFIMVCLSILFTHQHHLLDLIAGLEIAWITHFTVFRHFSGRKKNEACGEFHIINTPISPGNQETKNISKSKLTDVA